MNKKAYLIPRSTQFDLETENMIAASKPGGDDDYDGTAEIPPFEWGSNHKDGWSSEEWLNPEE